MRVFDGQVHLLEDTFEGMQTTAEVVDTLRDAGFDPASDSINRIELFDNLVTIQVASAMDGTLTTYAIDLQEVALASMQ